MARRAGTRRGQLELGLAARGAWGGARRGAGRKRKAARPGVPHRARPSMSGREPAHVTWRMAEAVPSLRSRGCRDGVRAALEAVRDSESFRVVEWSAQPTHLHLVVECADAAALSRGLRSLAIRLVWALRRAVGLRGPLLADRYHLHVLRSLREAVNAVRYVRENTRRHAEALAARERTRGGRASAAGVPRPGWRDPLSSAAESWAARARTWLLRTARQRVSHR